MHARVLVSLAAGMAPLVFAVVGCVAVPVEVEPAPQPTVLTPLRTGPVRAFAFRTLQGEVLTHAALRGRLTVIVLATTYDAASQAQTRFVNALVTHHTPRVNALLVVLEPAHHQPLVEAFVGALNLRYPAVMADEATIAGRGAFPGMHTVPGVLVLDPESREVFRHQGLLSEKDLSDVLTRAR